MNRKKVHELLEYCRSRANNPIQGCAPARACTVRYVDHMLSVQDLGDERLVVIRKRRKVAGWHTSRVSYDRLVDRFSRLLEKRLARKRDREVAR